MQTFSVRLTRALVIEGRVRRSGSVVSVTERAAKDLLTRGKATLEPVAVSDGASLPAIEDLTVAELREMAAAYGLAVPAKASKADLVAMIKAFETGE